MHTSTVLQKIKALAKEYLAESIAVRRHLHTHPELSFEEFKTSDYICTKLKEYGIAYAQGIVKTGIVAIVEGQNPNKKVVAIRADMDALPIVEKNEVPYKSVNEGVMHGCVHDVHSASALMAARILNELKTEWEGTVKIIFQPGEEKLPGGASVMIKEGVLENPAPASVIGQHVMPQLPVGKIGFRKGLYMASADEIYVTVHGKGGHAAMPNTFIDPVMITAQILTGLQQVVSRFARPQIPSVLSFGKVIANGATNVIPDKVYLEGTFRTMDEQWRDEAHSRMKKMAEEIASAMGGKCDFNIHRGYPFLVNNEPLTERTRQWAVEYMGEENIEDLDIWMAAEDFAYYSQVAPACFYRLGVRNEKMGITSSVHTSTFNIDESALENGMGLMSWLAIRELEFN